jgi:Tfp pilus assembly PilM family ATPase
MSCSSKVNNEELAEAAPSLVIAVGLAMRGYN